MKRTISMNMGSKTVRCYTLIEILVVIMIMGMLMMLVTSGIGAARKKIIGKDGKAKAYTTASLLEDKLEKDRQNPGNADPRQNMTETAKQLSGGLVQISAKQSSGTQDTPSSAAGSARKPAGQTSSGKGKQTAAQASSDKGQQSYVPASSGKGKRSAATDSSGGSRQTDEQTSVVPEEIDAETVFPEPKGFPEKSFCITSIDPTAKETEPFACYLGEKGSTCTLDAYRKLWNKDREDIQKGRALKKKQYLKVTVFEQYIRRETVFQTSPYRTWLLRKRLLYTSRIPFDTEKEKTKLQRRAAQKFRMIRYGESITVPLKKKSYTGVYRGLDSRTKRIKISGKRFLLSEIPEDIRWRFDEKLLNLRREEYVKSQLADLEKEFNTKQLEYIRKTLDAEFPMLAKDPMMTLQLKK